jgi:dipeptidyl aminopeptidase/acylaminoacyl peptidase
MATRPGSRPTVRPSTRDRLTIEQIVAVESPSAFRISPDGRQVAFVAEAAGARQLFTMPIRGGGPVVQLTASEKDVSDPQWNLAGDRLAYVRDKAIWVIDADGGRAARLVDHPAGSSTPRWSPDGDRLLFMSRRRGWDQLWLIEVPRPARGRPPAAGRRPDPVCLTPTPHDSESPTWSPDGSRIAFVSQRTENLLAQQVLVLDVAAALGLSARATNRRSGQQAYAPAAGANGVAAPVRTVAGQSSWACGPRWMPDGRTLLYLDDRDGWFRVHACDLTRADGSGQSRITDGAAEFGEPSGGEPFIPRVSPTGSHVAHIHVHDGLIDLEVVSLDHVRAGRRVAPGKLDSVSVNPFPGLWRLVDWWGPDHVAAVAESDDRPQDLWLLPVPGLAAPSARPRQVTDSRPRSVPVHRFVTSERVRVTACDGLPIECTLWRPPEATGRDKGKRVPVVLHPHGGPTWQQYRGWQPFLQLMAQEGIAVLAPDFRGSTGYGRDFRWANRGEWGHADLFDVIDAARWAAAQPWANGRLGVFGGSYGGYLALCALVEEPTMWNAGVDLYGDSEIAESYRHGDRPGRIDLERMMGKPEDPGAAAAYRRGSPLYRAERIEAPLLILHGRQDHRVVPLMSEKMIEALTIEGKFHEVHWYEEEGHGWTRRENRRDAFSRILAFLKRHLLEEEPAPGG